MHIACDLYSRVSSAREVAISKKQKLSDSTLCHTGASRRERQRRDGRGVSKHRHERHVREECAVRPRVDAELVEVRRGKPLTIRAQRDAHRRTAQAQLINQPTVEFRDKTQCTSLCTGTFTVYSLGGALTRKAFQLSTSGGKFLDNSQGLDVISLLVNIMCDWHKVIKILKFKSAMNFQWEAESREHDRVRFRNRMRSLDCAPINNHCKFEFAVVVL